MKKLLSAFAGFLLITSMCIPMLATADSGTTADQAIAMVKKAVAYEKENGKDKAFAAINDPKNTDFHDRDLYIFVYDMNGFAVAHGNNPKLIGKSLIDLKDVDGKYVVRTLIDIANSKGKGWLDYKWPNPVTKNADLKSAYIEKTSDGLIIGSGIYKPQ